MKEKIVKILKQNKNKYISGEIISDELNVTRTSIWKYISVLRKEGYVIDSASRKGYKLISYPDVLDIEVLERKLSTNHIGKTIYYYDTVDSTNIKAKNIALDENNGAVIISEEQTKGRGRLGRDWISPKYKGVWMSIILKPNIPPEDAPKITQIAAAAVSKSFDDLGIKNKIKWPNDIVINKKKVCGILTEMSGEIGRLKYIVIGIGINANLDEKDLTDDIKEMATSIKIENGSIVNRENLIIDILEKFEYLYEDFLKTKSLNKTLDICSEKSALLGKMVYLVKGEERFKVRAIDLDSEGRLIVEDKLGNKETIISGEISIRGLENYV
ncbi:biotin--[acetyl-CoA-carboxylase] ligase [Senegalia massiliensis]|uniref:Bifunctional ligase/repressor BirA n=1 Tax=Senegalia massiliensis TaxID=1720316 RepID=A0A845R1B7_9CLOT|nr:biotin--[acetyl-CoA-carboxylase] ligase [Senegalia massiliensis]NBI07516.1 biotin--[acetyl-CoA-carboxylase] ligase [Senegalia massiliensis]